MEPKTSSWRLSLIIFLYTGTVVANYILQDGRPPLLIPPEVRLGNIHRFWEQACKNTTNITGELQDIRIYLNTSKEQRFDKLIQTFDCCKESQTVKDTRYDLIQIRWFVEFYLDIITKLADISPGKNKSRSCENVRVDVTKFAEDAGNFLLYLINRMANSITMVHQNDNEGARGLLLAYVHSLYGHCSKCSVLQPRKDATDLRDELIHIQVISFQLYKGAKQALPDEISEFESRVQEQIQTFDSLHLSASSSWLTYLMCLMCFPFI